jgi:hypothetical protein
MSAWDLKEEEHKNRRQVAKRLAKQIGADAREVDAILKWWGTSTEAGPALALQTLAAEEFGLKSNEYIKGKMDWWLDIRKRDYAYKSDIDNSYEFNGVYPFEGKGRKTWQVETKRDWPPDAKETSRRMLRVMYEDTQRGLADSGVDNVTLYRGIAFPHNAEGRDRTPDNIRRSVLDNANPLESWTTSLDAAQYFASRGASGGMVVRATVPKEKILSTAMTGFGVRYVYETILLGGPDDVEVAEEHLR